MNFAKSIIALLFTIVLFCSFGKKEITWVAIGDSITYLNDHTDETGNRVTKGYLTGVVNHFDGLRYINQGHNGWTSGNIAEKIDNLGLVKADIYSVFLGTNDWWQGRPVGKLVDYINNNGNTTLYGSFRIIINKIRSLNPQAKILLITPMQKADFVYINNPENNGYGSYKAKNGQYLEDFANAIDSIGSYEHIAVVDLYHNLALSFNKMVNFKRLKNPVSGKYMNYRYPEAAGIPFNPKTDEYPYPKDAINLTYDGLHPSDKGNLIIADAVATAFGQFHLAMAYKGIKADSSRWKAYINLDTYLKPFWKADTIIDETVEPIKDANGTTARLLFKAQKILSVKATNYSGEFIKGRDWEYANNELVFSPNSTVPFLRPGDLVVDKKTPGYAFQGKIPGTYVLAGEGPFFSSRQVSVTYIKYKSNAWAGPIPEFAAAGLPKTIAKLKHGEHLKMVFYGNSIEAGANASNHENTPPYMPTWPELVVYNLKHTYGNNIDFANKSVGGKLAKWGVDSVSDRVVSEKPDLVIIGFGMNDGTFKVSPDIYRAEIKGIIDSVSMQNPDAEFILIAPMLANPVSNFSGLQPLYKVELDKLKRKGVFVADMTAVHAELLKHKTYQDMTGNNINHPNDYLVRWYAQFISGFLIK